MSSKDRFPLLMLANAWGLMEQTEVVTEDTIFPLEWESTPKKELDFDSPNRRALKNRKVGDIEDQMEMEHTIGQQCTSYAQGTPKYRQGAQGGRPWEPLHEPRLHQADWACQA
jgi:hypothetical protein